MKYGLSDAIIARICAVFARFPAIEKAVLYGSRAKGNYKPGSDIDLTIYGENLTTSQLGDITDELDDLLLPYMIDLSIFAHLGHADLR
ncbi:MAG: nucleotidyltransferase domain-containing protein, partial [Deltaproteobacteria bacterium]|nr:nucleotidyltransferase domain-containing protein [Deltaproteobacteria bacterium]